MELVEKQIQGNLKLISSGLRSLRKALDFSQSFQRGELEIKLVIHLKEAKSNIRKLKSLYHSVDIEEEEEKIEIKSRIQEYSEEYNLNKKIFESLKQESMKTELITYADSYQEFPERESFLSEERNIELDTIKSHEIREEELNLDRVGDEDLGNLRDSENSDMVEEGEELTNDQIADLMFKECFEIQDENVEIVEKLLAKADKANNQASAINEKLEAQNEQLIDISHDLDDLKGHIQRAGREIRSFMRGVATDKILVVLCFLCVCIVMIVVILFVVCRIYVCTLICKQLGEDAIKKCKKIPLMYQEYDSD